MNLTYKEAGVDIDAGAQLVERIRDCAASTSRPEVLAGLGGFGALTELPAGYRQPVLVSATDGVGTKLRLAVDLQRHDGVGLDLVAMCVNDLVVQGAEPLFFLDYYATSRLHVELAAQVIRSIARGCSLAGCALVGGETAEMPGMYQDGDYDLAGFAVGIVEKSSLIDGSRITRGDSLIALASSGPHSNGYSLIRHILALTGADPLRQHLPSGALLADVLMEPTRIYVRSLLALTRQHEVHAMAHITGGGFYDNLPRVLPEGLCACCERASWQMPEIFLWLREQGKIAEQELLRTFNCGVGMVVIVPAYEQDAALKLLREHGEQAWLLGSIESAVQGKQVRML